MTPTYFKIIPKEMGVGGGAVGRGKDELRLAGQAQLWKLDHEHKAVCLLLFFIGI